MLSYVLVRIGNGIDVPGSASDCPPISHPYTLEIVYTENAQSQTIDIYQVHNRSTEYIASYSGYGKDYHIETNEICLMDQTYEVICMATYVYLLLVM